MERNGTEQRKIKRSKIKSVNEKRNTQLHAHTHNRTHTHSQSFYFIVNASNVQNSILATTKNPHNFESVASHTALYLFVALNRRRRRCRCRFFIVFLVFSFSLLYFRV